MSFAPEVASLIMAELNAAMQLPVADAQKLDRIFNTLVFMQANLLAHRLRATIGDAVYMGPFKGMRLSKEAMVKSYGPQLLGSYEHELHPIVERIIATPYDKILNIGCNFGYYSVGLARRMPNAVVHAFDIDENMQQKCRANAILNHVQDRVIVDGFFKGENFALHHDARTLVVVDIEGAEMELLDPVQYPVLKDMDILVELHDLFNPAISQTIMERFASTHDVELVHNRPFLFDLGTLAAPGVYIDSFDSFLITWEYRCGPTPWAYMRKK